MKLNWIDYPSNLEAKVASSVFNLQASYFVQNNLNLVEVWSFVQR